VRVLATSRERYAPRANTCTVCHRWRASHSEAAFRCRGSQLPRRLFVERAAATMNEFELADADAAIVAEICENWTEFRLRSSLQQPASRSPSTTTWSRQSGRIEPCQCQGKWPDRPLDHRSGCPRVPVAVRTSRLSSREEGKAIIFTPVRESSGESQLRSCRRSRSDASASPKKLQVIIYLCSGGAAFVTGANIAINGGQHMQ
jgi:hypothetical protein